MLWVAEALLRFSGGTKRLLLSDIVTSMHRI
jgi:hypothetical protein